MRKINSCLKNAFALTAFIAIWLTSAAAFAQFTIEPNLTPAQIAARLQGAGVIVSDVRIITPSNNNSYGGFDVALPENELAAINLGSTGIFMGSGPANGGTGLASPPGGYISGTTTGAAFASPLLSALPGVTGAVRDLCYIEIDIIPEGDTIKFPFTFGSTEYPTFVNSTFNDAFGFFISGTNPNPGSPAFPGGAAIPGDYVDLNLAVVPGTAAAPVSINSINWGQAGPLGGPATNPEFYYHNQNVALFANTPAFGPTPFPISPAGQQISMNGLTRNLVAVAAVVPCQTYTIKLQISDIVDTALDSYVFIEKIVSDELIIDLPLTSWDGCDVIEYEATRNVEDETTVASYILDISGSAVDNDIVDITGIPTDFTITGSGSFGFTLDPDYDAVDPVTGDTLIIQIFRTSICDPTATDLILVDSSTLILVPAPFIGEDRLVCTTVEETFSVNFPYENMEWTVVTATGTFIEGSGPGAGTSYTYNPQFSTDFDGTQPEQQFLIFTASNATGCVQSDTLELETYGIEVPVDLGGDIEICLGETVALQATAIYTTYRWDFFDGTGIDSETIVRVSNDSLESFTGLAPGEYKVRLTVFEGEVCENDDEILITVFDRPKANFDAPSITLCNVDGEVILNAAENITNGGDNPAFQWFADGVAIDGATESTLAVFNPADDVPITVTYTVQITNTETTCDDTENITVRYFPNPIMENLPAEVFTCGDSVTLDARALNLAEGTPTGYVWYYEPTGSIPLSTSPILRAAEQGVYTVEVTTNECVTVQSVTLVCPEDVGGGRVPYRVNLSVDPSTGSAEAALFWNAPEEGDNVEYFEIFGFDVRYLSTKVGETADNQFRVTGLLNGITYNFAVRPVFKRPNGTLEYGELSNVVTVRPSIVLGEEQAVENAFTVFPNPNEGNFNVRWNGLNTQELKFTVFNVNGQIVYRKDIAASNSGTESISLSNLAGGLYILKIDTDKGSTQHKISIVR
ncbi:MAG: T9SS type A sorting domain-containing protein [Bernardetiaceae bacterium]|nr:T9SS type A sorting domain-containing protein [Bernardetiaceae bacterium]